MLEAAFFYFYIDSYIDSYIFYLFLILSQGIIFLHFFRNFSACFFKTGTY